MLKISLKLSIDKIYLELEIIWKHWQNKRISKSQPRFEKRMHFDIKILHLINGKVVPEGTRYWLMFVIWHSCDIISCPNLNIFRYHWIPPHCLFVIFVCSRKPPLSRHCDLLWSSSCRKQPDRRGERSAGKGRRRCKCNIINSIIKHSGVRYNTLYKENFRCRDGN